MTRRSWNGFVAAELVTAACGTDLGGDAASVEPDGDAAGGCLAEDPDCQDAGVPLPDEAPIQFRPGHGRSHRGWPAAGSRVVDTQIDGGFAIRGYFHDDGSGPRQCEALAESFPPPCAGPSIPLDLNGNPAPTERVNQPGVPWTDTEVEITGRVVDGVSVDDPAGD